MKNHLAAVGLAAGLVAGGAAGLVLVPAAALGQTTAPPTTSTDELVRADPGEHLREILAPLVADGTLTQAQADKVIAAMQAAKPFGRSGLRHHRFLVSFDTVAATLGISEAQLHTALRGGQSIADLARSRGIAPGTVVDALVAELKTRLAKEVAAGDLSQSEADARLTKARTKITSMVDGVGPKGFRGSSERERAAVPAPTAGDVEPAMFVSA